MKKLQAALDLFDEKTLFEVLDEVAEYIDIIELGTPLMIAEGAKLIGKVKAKYPEKIVFADIKVMDGGAVVPEVAYKAGADMTSVLAVADNHTIQAAIQCAHKNGKLILVDMCNVADIHSRAKEIEPMKPDYICVHVGYDVQQTGVDPIVELRKLDGIGCAKAAAGGIQLATFEAACQSPADVIIVGGGLYNVPNRRETAQQMAQILAKYR